MLPPRWEASLRDGGIREAVLRSFDTAGVMPIVS
jgi:hypothetical protein